MQKHQRLALDAAREALRPLGLGIGGELPSRGGHLKVAIVDGAGAQVAHLVVSSSPASRDACVNNVRQAALRAGREALARRS